MKSEILPAADRVTAEFDDGFLVIEQEGDDPQIIAIPVAYARIFVEGILEGLSRLEADE